MILAVVDEDNDGYIDEPRFDINRDGVIDERDILDLDGDGKAGNTSLRYDDYYGTAKFKCGILHPTTTVNVNPVKPPRYFKVVNNIGPCGKPYCVYHVPNTADEGISDGGWYRAEAAPDTFGGFLGNTKFIYGTGEDEYFIGTKKKFEFETISFKFQ